MLSQAGLYLVIAVSSLLVVGAAAKKRKGKATVRHCVMGRFKTGTSDEQKRALVESVLGMPKDIAEICGIEAGLDLCLADGNHGFAATVDFRTADDYQVYAKHPAHVAVITNYIKPILEPGTRTAVQFRLP